MVAAAPALPTILRPRPAAPFLSSSPHLDRRRPRRAFTSRLSPLCPAKHLSPISAVEKTEGVAAAAEGDELEGMPPETTRSGKPVNGIGCNVSRMQCE